MKRLTAFLIVVIITLVGALAYFIGQRTAPNQASPTPSPSNGAVACTMDAKLCPDGSSVGRVAPSCEFAPCPSPTMQAVAGGGILSFPSYELLIPADWTVNRESDNPDMERITVSGDSITLSITQGGFGGSICLFPGDADFEGPSARYDYYQGITTRSGDKLRRAWTTGSGGFAICQLTDYGWNAPTLYGHISVTTPTSTNEDTLNLLDAVLTSLKTT